MDLKNFEKFGVSLWISKTSRNLKSAPQKLDFKVPKRKFESSKTDFGPHSFEFGTSREVWFRVSFGALAFLPCRALTKFILDDIRDFLRAKNPCVWWHVFLGLPAKRAHRPKEVATRLRRARAVVRQSRQNSFWDAVHQLHPGRHPRVFRIKESSCLASSRSFLSLSLTFQNDVPKRIIAWSLE